MRLENAEFEWKLLKRKVLNEKVKWNRISSELTIKFGGGRGRRVVVATTTSSTTMEAASTEGIISGKVFSPLSRFYVSLSLVDFV